MKFFSKNKGEPQKKEVTEKKKTSVLMKLKSIFSHIHAPAWWTNFWDSPKTAAAFAWMNRWSLLLHIPLSLLLVFAIEWMARHSLSGVMEFVHYHTKAYLYNSFLVYMILMLVYICPKRAFMRLLISSIILLLGIINGIILLNRVSPFGFTDISMVGDLLTMQNTKYFTVEQGIMAVIGVILLILVLILILVKNKKTKSKFPFWLRLILVALSIISIPVVTKGLQSYGVLSAYFGNLAQGYSDYGYLYGFGNSVFGLSMTKPVNYSASTVENVIEDNDMGETELTTDQEVNVVLILLESFYDATEANFLELSEDPIPYAHYLEENYSSGYLTVPVVGAGTCDTEFEVLTGMSMQFFGPGEYPQKTILKQIDSCESVASDLKTLGYSSHVVHNNGANFYSRQNAFSLMGFDTFTSKEMLDITEYNPLNTWPMDDILTDATVEAMDQTEGADFVYTITVETHGDYPKYDVFEDPDIDVNAVGKSEEVNYQWEYYVNMLHDEDRWIQSYLEALDERGEPTLVVMFGDHLPTLGLTESEVATGDLYQTKYFTWNNFGMEKEDQDLTSYNLMAEYLGRLGIHEGTMTNYNQSMLENGTRAGSISYMYGLEMLQYDLLYGKRYAYGDEDPYPAVDIVMGTHDVTIDRIYTYEGKVHIFGDGFTKWSDVYINDEAVSTKYVSGQHLTIDSDDVDIGDLIVVSQVGSGEDRLRSSNEVIYTDPTNDEGDAAAEEEAAEEEISEEAAEVEEQQAKLNQ